MRRLATRGDAPPAAPAPIARWPRRHLSIDGTTLAYIDEGPRRAESILLLHGYLGSHLSWRHLIDPLAARHRVIALDWLGWGESGRPAGLRYDYDTEVDRLRRVLDTLALPDCNLFAHDYGGFIGLGLCDRHPTRVRRLALLNSRAHGTFSHTWRMIFSLVGAASRAAVLHPLVVRQPVLAIHRASVRREFRRGIFNEDTFAYANAWMDTPEGRRFYVRFFTDYRVAPRVELAGRLADIRCPTAIIWSRINPYLPRRTPLELAARIPAATLTQVEAGHFITEERPQDVLDALLTLLARQR